MAGMNAADDMPKSGPAQRSGSGISRVRILRSSTTEQIAKTDNVVVEAPLEFQLHHPAVGPDPFSFGTTMRTPGDDEVLAAGLLYGEAVVNSSADIDAIESSTRRPNVVNVRLKQHVEFEMQVTARRFSAGSSCGVCGTTSLDATIARAAATRIPPTPAIDLKLLFELPSRMREAQAKFADTGGIHATALFDLDGNLLDATEDVGRHNAFDKLVGKNLLEGRLPFNERIVLLSGRASFELVQKALRAGVGILAAIGAPSSLAVGLAVAAGMTLAGFVRGTHCNVYSHPQRLGLSEGALSDVI
jgi:FdhD protein